MYRLYHLSFGFAGVPKMRDLEVAFSAPGDDWIRISATNWVVWTERDPNQLYFSLLPLLDINDNFLITAFAPAGTSGRLPMWAWSRINSKVAGTVAVGPFLPPPPQNSLF
jgi:hypothetical protein